jgi:hypothetical protein
MAKKMTAVHPRVNASRPTKKSRKIARTKSKKGRPSTTQLPSDQLQEVTAITPVTKAQTASKPEVVWSHDDFDHELDEARRIGPENMSDSDLVMLCQGVSGYLRAHFWVDARPFFLELWRRIDVGKLRMNKTEACRKIGCTRQWANAIVSGRADERREVRAKAKEAKDGNSVSSPNTITTTLTDQGYVHEITDHAFEMLAALLPTHRGRYRTICEELAKEFEEASKNPPDYDVVTPKKDEK